MIVTQKWRKTCFVHVKSGSQTLFFDPPLEKARGQLTPLTTCFRGLWFPVDECVAIRQYYHPYSNHFFVAIMGEWLPDPLNYALEHAGNDENARVGENKPKNLRRL